MFKRTNWRERALIAELTVVKLMAQLEARSGAVLVSMKRQGRLNRFTFQRNGKLIVVETYSTMDDNWSQWEKELLSDGNETH
jgi:hypothetical protein